MHSYLGKYAVIPLNFSRGTNIEAERSREVSYKKEKEAEVFTVRSISSHSVKVERAVSSAFARPRYCPFSSSSTSSSTSSSSSSFPSSHRSSTPTATSTATATATAVTTTRNTGSTSFKSASNYNPHHTFPNSSKSNSHSDTPTPTSTLTSSVNIPSLALVKCIQSCLSNSKSDDSPSNRSLSKSTLLYWNVENNNCHFENKKQKLAFNNVQIYPKMMIRDKNVNIVKNKIIDLCSDASSGVGSKHSNSNRDSNRNQNGNIFIDYKPVFLDLSSSSSSYPTSYPSSSSSSSSSASSSSSFTNRSSSKINPFEVMSLQQSENILLLVASNKSPMCLDINIILATANYNFTCPFSKEIYRNISQDMQATQPHPIPAPAPVPVPPTTTSFSTFNAPFKIKKKPCDEYTVMFRLPPCSNRLIGIFIAVPLGQSMSPLNSDYLNDVTAEGQGQGQGWGQGQGQEGAEGGRSSRIRILSTHCMDADRTANPHTFHETGPGRRCGAESGRGTDTVMDCVNNVLSVGDSGNGSTAGTGTGAGTSAGAKNRVRDCRITDSSFSCPDHFKPFYSPCL